jgi:serine/tyrosine/threonine adenylyltransferase
MAKAELALFMPAFEQHFETLMRAKLGLSDARAEDSAFIAQVFTLMMKGAVDYTLLFRRLTLLASGGSDMAFRKLFTDAAIADSFLALWKERVSGQPDVEAMRRTNPVRIARNHRVEEAINAAYAGDIAVAERLVEAMQSPFAEDASLEDLELPPTVDEEVRQTFCGT